MSTEVFYFSGTGNSLHVARELQKHLPETTLIPILSLSQEEYIEVKGKTVGFIFPQYGSQIPKIVAKTISKIDFQSVQYIFAIATRGGTECVAFKNFDNILKKWGRRLDSYFVITMPSGSDPLVEKYVDNITSERIARLETEMLNKLSRIEKIITAREVNREDDLNGLDLPPPDFMVPFLPLLMLLKPIILPLAKMAESNFNFYYDSKCTGCGMCEMVCLAQKVRMIAGRPVWQEKVKCHGCFACLNYCPEIAVQVKNTWYLKSCTPQNGRYHHPQITARDIAGQKSRI